MYRSSLAVALLILVFQIHIVSAEAPSDENSAYLDIGEKLMQEGLLGEGAYSLLEELLSVGPRFSGSPGKAAAVELMYRKMRDLGFDNVWLEPVTVPRWVRSEIEEARIVNSKSVGSVPLTIAALGGSVATPREGLTTGIVEVRSFEELQQLGERAKGKIVFFNRPMDRQLLDPFAAYSGAVNQRSRGAIEAAKVGAVAVLVRSMTMRIDDYPHTGAMRYGDDIPQIPAASISTKGAEYLSNLLRHEPDLNVHLRFTPEMMDSVQTYNVIGEIRGSEKPDEIVILAGHLDGWDITPGAHDDGAGCVQAVRAIGLLKDLGLRPKRTIRAVLYANEEFGVSGGRAYVNDVNRTGERHIAAIESDRGGFRPLGFTVDTDDETVAHFKQYEYLFRPYGMYEIKRGFGGVDIAPLRNTGTIAIGLLPDPQRYFDLHHSAKDTIETVNPRELELGAIAMALFGYVLAEDGVPSRMTEDSYTN
jgi:carboxypeptidase Q